MVSVNESYLWLFDVASGERTLITPKGGSEKTVYGGGRFGRDGRWIQVVSDRRDEFLRLASIDLGTGQYRPPTGGIDWDVYEYDVSPDGLGYLADGRWRMSEATTSGTGSLPASQSRTSVGHTPSFSASRACPHEMRFSSRLNCAGVNAPPIVVPMLPRDERV